MAYVFAVACVVVASCVRLLVELAAVDVVPLATYYPAVLVVALIAGAGAGLLAMVLGGIVGWLAFMTNSVSVWPSLGQSISLALYAVSNGLIVWMAASYRSALRSLEEQEDNRRLLLRELQHRSANTLASVQAIVAQTLRDNREEAQKINRRIAALSATDDLLTASEGQTADLRDLLLIELKPYGSAQVEMHGPKTNLRPVLARAIGLVCHELATNAAKYGALSRPDGRLAISWANLGGQVEVTWAEEGGPPVSPPTKAGFGTYFTKRILEGVQGKIETEFRSEGLLCRISFALPSVDAQSFSTGQVSPSSPFPVAAPGGG